MDVAAVGTMACLKREQSQTDDRELRPLLGATGAIHTPCATVYLSAAKAYKVRGAVDLGYLDFTTLAARKHVCEEELRLNAELAPGVYQAVVPIARGRGRRLVMLTDGEGLPRGAEVVEYAVKMRRLPEKGMLTAILEERGLSDAEVEAIVSRLATFHAKAAVGPTVRRHGSPAAVRRELLGNLSQIEPFVGGRHGVIEQEQFAHLRRWMTQQLDTLASVLKRRAATGRIREGHGDLHAGNVCFDPAARSRSNRTGLLIYDRLEFREDFRCKDVAAELACLASTFDARGHYELADRVVELYAKRARDPGILKLQPLYRAHYAAVRGKVHAVRSGQRGAPAAERARERDAARRFMQLAVGYALPPCLVITCGLPGSGKSVASRAVAAPLRAGIHRADEIRKGLAGLAPTDRGGKVLYTARMTERTYAAMLRRCRTDLRAGRSAIADATFRSRALRAGFIAAARALGAPVVIVHCYASVAETRRRLVARSAANADASDADMAVYERMRAEFEPPTTREASVEMCTPGRSLNELVAGVLGSLGAQAAGRARRRGSSNP